jgi:hypothetical protein
VTVRPSAGELLDREGAFLTRQDLIALGLTRVQVDAVFRELAVVMFPGTIKKVVKRDEYVALVERSTYRDDRVVPGFKR